MPTYYNSYELIAKKIIEHIGKSITLGIPLGIGKPIGITNALYRLAEADKSIQLTIFTGLTLARPDMKSDLEKKFLQPILERVLGNYEDPLYETARLKQQLPHNISVVEFFLAPGEYLKNAKVQQNYINTDYTNVVRDLINRSINVIAQQVSVSATHEGEYSLSSNTDLFLDVARHLREFESQGKKIAVLAEVNSNLPFMLNDAVVKAEVFTDIVDTKQYKKLFTVPKPQLSHQDHLIGLYGSALIKDDGCLQIGIGKLGDAITSSLLLRNKDNALYQDVFKKLRLHEKFNEVVTSVGELSPFRTGLYASTEMLCEGYMHLYDAKILKKQVYDHIGLQTLLNSRIISDTITPDYLSVLLENNIINEKLTKEDFLFLSHFGIIKSDVRYNESISKNDLCLGGKLKNGKIIHAGFFVGSNDFYQQLQNLSQEEMQKIDMTSVSRTNSLSWSQELSFLQRQHARFVNAAMMITLGGTVVSDGLKNWDEVSGVGGQFDFAVMGQKLLGSRFIINCHSTRRSRGKISSNIVWQYPNVTLSRNLRDIVVTEYGIADCRSKTDSEVMQALLNITDSRFQEKLLAVAKKSGKIAQNYNIPKIFQNNSPENFAPIVRELQSHGYCKPYPFGSELTAEEIVLKAVLLSLRNNTKLQLFFLLVKSLLFFKDDSTYQKYLARMELNRVKTVKNFIYKKLLKYLISKRYSKGV